MRLQNLLIIASLFCIINQLAADTTVSNSDGMQLFPKVAHPNDGGYIFAYVSNKDRQDFEIDTRAFDSNLGNGSTEVSLSTPDPVRGHRLNAEAIPSVEPLTSDKGAIVAWVNHDDQKVYAMRVTSTGAKGWVDFVLVHSANPYDNYMPPQVCSDGNGGAIFVYVNHYKQSESSYYDTLGVIHIKSDGTKDLAWPANITAPQNNEITIPRICAASSGEYYVAWAQVKDGQRWIRIVRINSSGNQQGSITDVVTAQEAGGGSFDPINKHHWTGLTLTRAGDKALLTMRYAFTFLPRSHPVIGARTVPFLIRESIWASVVSGVGASPVITNDSLDGYIFDPEFTSHPNDSFPNTSDPISREIYYTLSTPVAVANSDGSSYVVWSKESYYGNRDQYALNHIYISKISSSGDTTVWITQMDNSGFANRAPQVVSYNNDALVVWESMDYQGKNSKLRYRKITSGGTKGTEYDVSSSGNNGFSFDLINNSDTAIVVWSKNASADWDIYARKFNF